MLYLYCEHFQVFNALSVKKKSLEERRNSTNGSYVLKLLCSSPGSSLLEFCWCVSLGFGFSLKIQKWQCGSWPETCSHSITWAVRRVTLSSRQGKTSAFEPENAGDARSFEYAFLLESNYHSRSQMHFLLIRSPETAWHWQVYWHTRAFYPPLLRKEVFNSAGNQGLLHICLQ